MHRLHPSTALNQRRVFLSFFNAYILRVNLQLQKPSTVSSCQTRVGHLTRARLLFEPLKFRADRIIKGIFNDVRGNQLNDNRYQTITNCAMDEKAIEKAVEKAVERAVRRVCTQIAIVCVIVITLILCVAMALISWVAYSYVQIRMVLCLLSTYPSSPQSQQLLLGRGGRSLRRYLSIFSHVPSSC